MFGLFNVLSKNFNTKFSSARIALQGSGLTDYFKLSAISTFLCGYGAYELSKKSTKEQAYKNTAIGMLIGSLPVTFPIAIPFLVLKGIEREQIEENKRIQRREYCKDKLKMSLDHILHYELAEKKQLDQEYCKRNIEGIKIHEATLEKYNKIAEQFSLTIEQTLWHEIKFVDESLTGGSRPKLLEVDCYITPYQVYSSKDEVTNEAFRDTRYPIKSNKLKESCDSAELARSRFWRRVSTLEPDFYGESDWYGNGSNDVERSFYSFNVVKNIHPLQSDIHANVHFNYTITLNGGYTDHYETHIVRFLNVKPNDFYNRMLFNSNVSDCRLENLEICSGDVCMPIDISGSKCFLKAMFIAKETINDIAVYTPSNAITP